MRLLYITGWGYVAISAALIYRAGNAERYPEGQVLGVAVGGTGYQWFDQVRSHCNPVEVQLTLTRNPPPDGWEGQGYAAACQALAGRIARAQELIDALPEEKRYHAAGIVFNVGHPVADAGDDEAAGAIMELVLRYWPNHYMALYHAGAAQYRTGQPARARINLELFLQHYKEDDGWTASARETLKQIAQGRRP